MNLIDFLEILTTATQRTPGYTEILSNPCTLRVSLVKNRYEINKKKFSIAGILN